MSSEEMLQAVKEYTEMGFVVHPLSRPDSNKKSPGKKPLLDEWEKLTKTPPDIGKYITAGNNIGLVCGKASGITVIDIDHELFINELFKGFDLDTLKSGRITGRGHIYFKYNTNIISQKHHDLGIEILNDGSNAVLPPSVHVSNKVYKWNNPGAEIIEMPKALEVNLNKIFLTKAELKIMIWKCRTCFRKIFKDYPDNIPDMHGGEGREYMLAVCTDLKAAGATEAHIKMFAKLVYREKYDELRTLTEWGNIDPAKTWQCETIKAKLSAYIDPVQCAKCEADREAKKGKTSNVGGGSQASLLIKYVESDDVELFHDDIHNPYARIKLDGHYITLSIKEKGFKRWIMKQYYNATGAAAGNEAYSSAVNVIEAKACFDGNEHVLSNRICWHDGAIWYDLGNWEAIKITSQGWEVIENPPILFKKYKHQIAQKMEAEGETPTSNPKTQKWIETLLTFVNIKDEKEKLLFVVYLVTCFIPDIPHVIPVLHGDKGAAKSTLFKIVKELVDPSTLKLASFPKDNNELVQKLAHHYFIGFDNISSLSDWQSDAICRGSSGEGFSKRELYSDDEDVIYTYQRCIGLNGINVVATKPDLLDRSILLRLERIPKKDRKTEGELWKSINKVKAEILTGIFTTISKAMQNKPEIKLEELPRMADFAIWGVAIAKSIGYKEGDFMEAYNANIQSQNREAIESNPVGELVLKFMENKIEWSGRASELLNLLEELALANKINVKAKNFPKAANTLTRRLNELKSNLADEGIIFEVKKEENHNTITLSKAPGNTSSTSSYITQEVGDIKKAGGTETMNLQPNIQIPPAEHPTKDDEKKTGDTTISENTLPPAILPNKKQEAEVNAGYAGYTGGIFRTYTGEAPIELMEKIQKHGHDWQKSHGQINSVNLIDFCSYCFSVFGGSIYDIETHARNIYKITPDTKPAYTRPEHLTELCKRGVHAPDGCGGADCTCECHTPKKEP